MSTRRRPLLRGAILSGVLLMLVPENLAPIAVAETYTYDAAARLTAITYDSGERLSFSYDANGNLKTRTVEAETAGDGVAASSLSVSWVQIGYGGTELGTQSNPFDTFREGVTAVVPGGTVRMKAGSANESLTISKPMTIRSSGGTAQIG